MCVCVCVNRLLLNWRVSDVPTSLLKSLLELFVGPLRAETDSEFVQSHAKFASVKYVRHGQHS